MATQTVRAFSKKDKERSKEMRVLRQALPDNGLPPVTKAQEARLLEGEADDRALATLEEAYPNGFPKDRKSDLPIAAPSGGSNQGYRDRRQGFGGQA